jgi:hypothetical protein
VCVCASFFPLPPPLRRRLLVFGFVCFFGVLVSKCHIYLSYEGEIVDTGRP